eukprot:tig00000140_g8469.t1
MEFIPVIDAQGNYTNAVNRFAETLRSGDYFSVSVLGAQSTGKSTLLNILFGTGFPVLQPISGRTQTTKGVYLAKAANSNVLAVDVEGIDSREREGEGLEKKFALFSVAVANVVILNLWTHDVGRREASNYPLLSTVFEEYLKLFGNRNAAPATLLVVFRDHDETCPPVASLRQQVAADLQEIWEGLSKPAGRQLSDFFRLEFESLPHYRYNRAGFDRAVSDLQSRFLGAGRAGYLFGSDASSPRQVADKLQGTWTAINSDAALNVPSARELSAVFRCDEVMQQKLGDASRTFAKWRQLVNNGDTVDGLGNKSKELIDTTVAEFQAATAAYAATSARARKEEELRSALSAELYGIYSQQVVALRDQTFARIKAAIIQSTPLTAAPRISITESDFKTLLDSAENFFTKQATESKPKDSDWAFDEEKAELRKMMSEFIADRQKVLKSIPGPGRAKPGWFLSPNVEFNTTFSLLTAINLGPRQTVGMPLGDDIVDSSPLPPNSVYSDSNGDAGVNLDKIDYSGGDSASSRLAPYSRS